MRYYKIKISDPQSGQVIVPPGFQGLLGDASYTSFINGQSIPGAWQVELDIPVIGQATPQGFGGCVIWGVSNQELGQANNLIGKNISIYGGMQKGLPLANPAQAGLLVQGYVYQAFGHNLDTARSLNLVIAPGSASGSAAGGIGTLAKPKNLVLNWKANTPLSQALQNTLQTAFPGYTVTININASIVRANDEAGFFPTLELLSKYVRQTSLDIIKTANYAGVTIVLNQNSLSVFDGSATSGTSSTSPKQIAFQDLIGQPTWIESPNISFKTVMRGDTNVGDKIMLPQSQVTNSQAAASSLINQQATFQGGFTVVSERHVGNYRQPSADSWVTVFEGAPNQVVGATA